MLSLGVPGDAWKWMYLEMLISVGVSTVIWSFLVIAHFQIVFYIC